MLTLNRVTLLGSLPEEPKLVCSENDIPQYSFTLVVEERGQEHTDRLYAPVDAVGDKAAKTAESISAGDAVLIDGKLRWRLGEEVSSMMTRKRFLAAFDLMQ